MHHPHHPPQQGPPPHHLQQPRPSGNVHPQHPQHQQQHQQHHPQGPPNQAQHPNPYPPHSGLPQYPQGPSNSGNQISQEAPYYQSHPSPYNTPAPGTYSAATETPEIMAAAQMGARPYPPISYHTPQSNPSAPVPSPAGHDQHRMYGAPPPQIQQNAQMYYPGHQQQYPPMPAQGPPSYAPHPQQHHQPMASQPNLMMTHASEQHQMPQHQAQHAQQNMSGSPRPKIEPHTPQIPRPAAPQPPPQQQPPQQHQQQQANGALLNKNNPPPNAGNVGVNPNAAPGPIPATTPLVVRQDNNGVQWIAFEYSRDRVKMEYTIRCDVETVNVDSLSKDFKAENCVYPRACCAKEQYRGNRLVYETECNTVGWALAELNPCLRGKRGLIQRAVDSWRNSNQDERLRSRRVRRMAKMNTRKSTAPNTPQQTMDGAGGPAGIPTSSNMDPGTTGGMGKPSLGGMSSTQLHHHHNHPDGGAPGGDDVGESDNIDSGPGQGLIQTQRLEQQNQTPSDRDKARRSIVFPEYSNSPYTCSPSVGGTPTTLAAHMEPQPAHPIPTPSAIISSSRPNEELDEEDRLKLFGDIPESKKRKFILVDDPGKSGRVRVRVTLDTVNINEIPDSFRKNNSVYPRSWFPLQMQSLPPSANGGHIFEDEDEDDLVEVTARETRNSKGKMRTSVTLSDGAEGEIGVPRIRKSMRRKEIRLNDLGYRMTWHQSRVFADKTVFLQKALDSYRNKIRTTMESIGKDVSSTAPHFETRVGKRRWCERNKRERRSLDET